MTDLQTSLDLLRHAANARLCVELGYNGTQRLVEPYGLRPTPDGGVLLHARKHDTEALRTYRVDRIERVRLTDVRFHPRFSAEMTAGGPLLGLDRVQPILPS